MNTTISGIPCEVRVTHYPPYFPATWWEPADGPEIEFEVLDTKGYKAEWLARKMTKADEERIATECLEYIRAEEQDYDPEPDYYDDIRTRL